MHLCCVVDKFCVSCIYLAIKSVAGHMPSVILILFVLFSKSAKLLKVHIIVIWSKFFINCNYMKICNLLHSMRIAIGPTLVYTVDLLYIARINVCSSAMRNCHYSMTNKSKPKGQYESETVFLSEKN